MLPFQRPGSQESAYNYLHPSGIKLKNGALKKWASFDQAYTIAHLEVMSVGNGIQEESS